MLQRYLLRKKKPKAPFANPMHCIVSTDYLVSLYPYFYSPGLYRLLKRKGNKTCRAYTPQKTLQLFRDLQPIIVDASALSKADLGGWAEVGFLTLVTSKQPNIECLPAYPIQQFRFMYIE
ncbi:hypothetical protein ABW19_dt0203894 [Dactylella cylindrospora]|nr:hypothetical protein ABW19_dt0203894 [Dactylella cylindrospora]